MLKVGDRVKVKKNTKNIDYFGIGYEFVEEAKGKIFTIKYIQKTGQTTYVGVEDNWYDWNIELLELVQPKQFTKSDLKERWLVKLRNGKECVVEKNQFARIHEGKKVKEYFTFDWFNEDLTQKTKETDFDVVEIYKPHYEKVWTREEEAKEMTVAEIEEQLGYKVKIVKGEK